MKRHIVGDNHIAVFNFFSFAVSKFFDPGLLGQAGVGFGIGHVRQMIGKDSGGFAGERFIAGDLRIGGNICAGDVADQQIALNIENFTATSVSLFYRSVLLFGFFVEFFVAFDLDLIELDGEQTKADDGRCGNQLNPDLYGVITGQHPSSCSSPEEFSAARALPSCALLRPFPYRQDHS